MPSNLSKRFLRYDSINTTSNPQDFTFTFSDPNYTNKSLLNICIACGDPSRSALLNTIYKNPDITSFTDYITASLPIQKRKADDFIANLATNYTTELPIILNHYEKNIYCNIVYVSGNPCCVEYPIAIGNLHLVYNKIENGEVAYLTEVTMRTKLADIVYKYFCLTNLRFAGKSLDEWIDDGVVCQTFLANNLINIIMDIDPDYYPLNGYRSDIEDVDHFKNAKNKSYQAAKYGKAINDGAPIDLFNGTFLDLVTPGTFSGQNGDDFGSSYNSPGFGFHPLRNFIGFLFYDKSTYLSAVGHEIGHKLSIKYQNPTTGRLERILTLSNGAELATIFQLPKLINAYKAGLSYDPVKKEYKDADNKEVNEYDISSFFNEQIADILGILLVESYVKTLKTSDEQLRAISFAQLWACGSGARKNGASLGHPPVSLSRNILFLNKYLHDTYNALTARGGSALVTSYCRAIVGKKTYGGGFRKTKRNRKNRKATHRRRR
jgi:hypothetical protein